MKKSKKKASNKFIYCDECGYKNDILNKRCTACANVLNRGDHPIWDTIKLIIKDFTEGQFADGLYELFNGIIRKYLYGLILTIAIAISATAVVINANAPKNDVATASDNYSFRPLTEQEKMVGCWKITMVDEQEKYERIDNDLNIIDSRNMTATSFLGGAIVKDLYRNGTSNKKIKKVDYMPGEYIQKAQYVMRDTNVVETTPSELADKTMLSRAFGYAESIDGEIVAGESIPLGYMVWDDDNNFDIVGFNDESQTIENLGKYTRISCNDFSNL